MIFSIRRCVHFSERKKGGGQIPLHFLFSADKRLCSTVAHFCGILKRRALDNSFRTRMVITSVRRVNERFIGEQSPGEDSLFQDHQYRPTSWALFISPKLVILVQAR